MVLTHSTEDLEKYMSSLHIKELAGPFISRKIDMDNKKTENCMICGEELAYLTAAIPVKCTYCGKSESANIHCQSGHYICNECHASDSIKIITQFSLSSKSKNPVEMAKTIMKHPTMPMHGPEHHAMIAAVLVTEYIPVSKPKCEHSHRNKQCSRAECRFYAGL